MQTQDNKWCLERRCWEVEDRGKCADPAAAYPNLDVSYCSEAHNCHNGRLTFIRGRKLKRWTIKGLSVSVETTRLLVLVAKFRYI